ncbi:MAG: DUF892 family protein, partial [Ktedonobacterales bacterium]|nr:DUF892 family protein [Ktedonobacterales bacterium]
MTRRKARRPAERRARALVHVLRPERPRGSGPSSLAAMRQRGAEKEESMRQDEALRDKLVSFLQDAYAMEHQITVVLERQVKETAKYADIQAHIQENLDATRQHQARIKERLRAHGKQPSAVKGLLSGLMGGMHAALGTTRSHELLLNARDDYAVEHFEIATYSALLYVA